LPFVRGRILPEVQSTGRAKRTLDALLYLEKTTGLTLAPLDELEQLRIYLTSSEANISIRLLVPESHSHTQESLQQIGIQYIPIAESSETEIVPKHVSERLDDPLRVLLATALKYDADCVVVDNHHLLPYIQEFGEANVLLTSVEFLLRYSEIFSRGHDVPWAFAHKVWFEPWMRFYPLSENWTFKPGMEFLALCQGKGGNRDGIELCRSLAYNRLADLCFTRDRLSFYEMQQAVAKRRHWKRQKFSAEIAYYLNFYYLLLYGAFDHAAAMVNALFSLGIDERQVGARNPVFLKALRTRLVDVHAVFVKPTYVEFVRRLAALRHVAAHRGIVTPTNVVRDLAHPPTNDELDQDIREAGLDYLFLSLLPGPERDNFREMLRSNARAARYEKETLMEDVVLIEIDGKYWWVHPLNDTWWNFRTCLSFLLDVFSACSKALP